MAFQETQKYRQHFPNCQEKVSSKVHYQSNLVHATNCDQHQWPALDDQRYARWLESALIWSTGPSLSKYTHVIYIYTRIVSLCITPCHSYPLPSISNLHWYLYVQYYVYWSSELRILILIPRLSMFAYFTSNYCSVLDSLRMQLNVDMDMSDKVGSCRWLAISCIILYHLISSYTILYQLIYSINWSVTVSLWMLRTCSVGLLQAQAISLNLAGEPRCLAHLATGKTEINRTSSTSGVEGKMGEGFSMIWAVHEFVHFDRGYLVLVDSSCT